MAPVTSSNSKNIDKYFWNTVDEAVFAYSCSTSPQVQRPIFKHQNVFSHSNGEVSSFKWRSCTFFKNRANAKY